MWILEIILFAYLVTLRRDLKGVIKKIKNHLEIKSTFNFIEITDKGVPTPALHQSLVDIMFLTIV